MLVGHHVPAVGKKYPQPVTVWQQSPIIVPTISKKDHSVVLERAQPTAQPVPGTGRSIRKAIPPGVLRLHTALTVVWQLLLVITKPAVVKYFSISLKSSKRYDSPRCENAAVTAVYISTLLPFF